MVEATKVPVNTLADGISARDLAELIFGGSVDVTAATFRGDDASAGIYANGGAAPRVVPGETGIILSTGQAQDFTNESGDANQFVNTSTNTAGPDDVAQLNAAAGARTFDSATLDVDFIPTAPVLTLDFIFSSEEYQEFENSIYQDFVGVWVNGNRVTMDVGNGDIDPGNINSSNNINMHVDNQESDANTEMDGFSITLSLTMQVTPGSVNSLRIAIADVADENYDSNLLIAADAVQTEVVAVTDSVTLNPAGDKDLDVLANDLSASGSTLSITQINGMDVVAEQSVTLPTGQTITLNADGTLKVAGDGDVEDFNFTYTIFDGFTSDVGLVNASSVPCFVAGTQIATPFGERSVEDLAPGDLVLTQDEGAQALRWVGIRTVKASGQFAPIRLRSDEFALRRDVLLSPLHRVLLRDPRAPLLFGDAEVLVHARDLVSGGGAQREEGGDVTYVHLLFERHQIVFADGLRTESYLPGPQTRPSFEAAMVEEIFSLFPQINSDTGQGYGPAARRCLRRFEAEVLMQASGRAA
ncbi:MAG: Hint domain-containing protein [Pseudomonadota bacterium]